MDLNIKNILCPVNFSKTSMNALNTAVMMCKRHKATLHLLHVTSPEYFYPPAGMQAPVIALAEEMIQSDIDNVANLAASIQRTYQVTCFSHNEIGPVSPTISKTAEELHCDVVVIGAGGSAGIGYINESIAYKVLKASDCAVLAVPGGKTINFFKKVVFPIRPVLNALAKYSFTRSILRKNDSEVHIVGAMQGEEISRFATVRKMVDEVEQALDREKISNSLEYDFHKNIGQKLIDICNNAHADLIVITASTKRSFRQIFSGNFTEKILNNNSTAVLCIKPGIE